MKANGLSSSHLESWGVVLIGLTEQVESAVYDALGETPCFAVQSWVEAGATIERRKPSAIVVDVSAVGREQCLASIAALRQDARTEGLRIVVLIADDDTEIGRWVDAGAKAVYRVGSDVRMIAAAAKGGVVMLRPRLLDLFCGGGGCAVGYSRAGFDVVGVDNRQQPRYPFEFHQGDALEFAAEHGSAFDVIHASPPCQRYSVMRTIHNSGDRHPDLLAPTRSMLVRIGKPWVIENVMGAPMGGIVLCGTMFGLRVLRHRRFESSVFLWAPPPCVHDKVNRCVQTGRPAKRGQYMTVAGHISSVAVAREAMGIDWMKREELVQAIPPSFTFFVGTQLMTALEATQ